MSRPKGSKNKVKSTTAKVGRPKSVKAKSVKTGKSGRPVIHTLTSLKALKHEMKDKEITLLEVCAKHKLVYASVFAALKRNGLTRTYAKRKTVKTVSVAKTAKRKYTKRAVKETVSVSTEVASAPAIETSAPVAATEAPVVQAPAEVQKVA